MTTIALIGLTAALAIGAVCLFPWPEREPKPAARHRLTPDSPNEATGWMAALNHNAPRYPFPPAEAHMVMQDHIKCATSKCARKAAAFDVLTSSGAIRPRTKR